MAQVTFLLDSGSLDQAASLIYFYVHMYKNVVGTNIKRSESDVVVSASAHIS